MLSPVLLDATKDFNNAITGMHSYMIPIEGAVAFIVALTALFLLLKKPELVDKWLNKVLLLFCLVQIMFSVFLLISETGWTYGLQLGFFAIFGVFASLTGNKNYLRVYCLMALLFTFALSGFMSFLGYPLLYDTYDKGTTPTNCMGWYGLKLTDSDGNRNFPSVCYGWISFLRWVVLALMIMQPFQAFLAYYIIQEEKQEPALGDAGAPKTTYGAVE